MSRRTLGVVAVVVLVGVGCLAASSGGKSGVPCAEEAGVVSDFAGMGLASVFGSSLIWEYPGSKLSGDRSANAMGSPSRWSEEFTVFMQPAILALEAYRDCAWKLAAGS